MTLKRQRLGLALFLCVWTFFEAQALPPPIPIIRATPSDVDFGATFKQGTVRTRTFQLANEGSADLTVTAFEFGNPEIFSQVNDCSWPLAPGSSCTVTVTGNVPVVMPLPGTTSYFSQLRIQSNEPGDPVKARMLLNYGVNFSYELPDGTVVLGYRAPPTVVGTTRKFRIMLRSRLDVPVELEGLLLEVLPSMGLTFTHACPATLPARGACAMDFTFSPSAPTLLSSVVKVAAGASQDGPLIVTGDGVAMEGDADGDGLSNVDEIALGRDPGVKDNDIFTDPRLFAMQQYRDFLGRMGDNGGVSFWADRIASGSVSRADAIASFLGSGEFEAIAAPVTRLYLAYFLRVPEYPGLDYWIGSARGGNPLSSISSFFAGSGEFQSRYGVLDNAQFVDRVYRNVLGRAPDAGGQAFWLGQLTGGTSRGDVMLGFSESPENRSLTSNQSFVTMVYAGMLRRAPDATSYASWVSWLDAGNPRKLMIETVLASPDYRARFMP